ncbi:neutral/alkaline non-lysosomal ceramidase [Colletotrichum karsti]|uniref:Neutral ceramidase n=1 Tax=Colletotrichum karsti TaxID=1095194 RepID=A0A9P6LR93_9PEZI|nr:neutral/alkaline non-lysosomal ceramidase [Colletotrichum karsti]KAF9882182.1 neutral/alkaline non-lysosomal ceramidase [Colletotrichum karsti]
MPARRSVDKSPASPAAATQTASAPPSSRRAPRLLCLVGLILSCLVVYGLFTPQEVFYDGGKWFPGSFNTADIDAENDLYLLGAGRADITGPVVEINMMGYADPKQVGSGLRQRLYARAFIVGSVDRPDDRFVYVILDTQSGDTAVRYGVLRGIADLGYEYSMYGHHNLALTGTHSHSGPGAWLNYLLPQITSKGFNKQSYRAIVDGTLLAIRRAHESLEPGHLSVGTTKVKGANINRSLYAYMANPEEERSRYNISAEEDGSVEKDLTLLKFQRASDGKSMAVLTWFPTHGTSMLGNNTLISGDNKGVAAWLFEKSVRGQDHVTRNFIAGFSQANMGDVSPNVLGAWCEDGSGSQCDFKTSTCGDGKSQKCHARGPFFRKKDNGASSCYEIGRRQFDAARKLHDQMGDNAQRVRGSWVKSFHTFHNMSEFEFELPNGTEVRTCPAALGYSFAAGTSDGPGAFDFTQHDSNSSNTSPLWKVVSGLLKAPTQDQLACHAPKPILLDVGEVFNPYQWTPNIVDIQAFRVGQLVIIVSPGEASTMAGRRWKDAVRDEAESLFGGETEVKPIVVIGGPANSYTHYITTQQEYAIQRYEGASTLYGPYTLDAYINRTLTYLPSLGASSAKAPPSHAGRPFPPDNSDRSLSFITGVVRDGTPVFRSFGDVKEDVREKYSIGEVVRATFVGANPRNDLKLEGTYASVERLVIDRGGITKWDVVRDDQDWGLIFHWKRTSDLLATSEVEIVWETEEDAEPGTYRFRYHGDSKALGGKITSFEGTSGQFDLL